MFMRLSMYLKTHSGIHATVNCNDFLALGVMTNCVQESAWIRNKSYKHYLDYSNVPKLDEADLEEQFVRGSGPGGQATNKTNNAVMLKHKPTGLIVKCHETRSLWDNQKRAREILITKLDNLLNKECSIEAQIRTIQEKQLIRKKYKRKKLAEMKKAFQEREGLT
ncbi:probable peptide chain release factor C12orf65 homolog, mitochondrial [Odontomachus brunneus]|uniref:probable peptide chain release factor C12orf65 homolog, mitochondrial n=1 Tax=Odontomachus brunneus TaxID=486640 RepID=UPI0013F1CCC4|nr:probable peptide chain release factor C12orf65 homolog, mitochondrial [Odontomachus brunneus]XP_032689061.1 probable peptide chain release factor C12orf65 homolog, mitochondrial [Odontomachus brunneus]